MKPAAIAKLLRTPVGQLERTLSLGILGGVAATLFLGQIVTALLYVSPSSVLLWRLYFEYSRPLDVFYQLARGLFGETGLFGFTTILLAVAAATVVAIHSGVRLLRAVAYHGLFAATGLLLYFTVFPAAATTSILGAWSPGIAAVASLFALLSFVQCVRVHGEILRAARAWRRLALAAEPAAARAPMLPRPAKADTA